MTGRRRLAAALTLLAACSNREPDAAAPAPAASPAEPARPPLVTLELGLVDADTRAKIATHHDSSSPLVTAEALLAVHHRIAEPWHIYWTNPGESGLRTRVKISGAGIEAGEVLYPAPERFVAPGGQVSYGWAGEAVLFVPLTKLDADARIELRGDWLACHESCIPGQTTIETSLSDLEAELGTRSEPIIETMLARVPEPAGDRLETRWADGTLHVEAAAAELELREFFPYARTAATLETSELRDGALDLRYRFDAPPTEPGQGVLGISLAGEPRWLELAAPWPPP